jgi:predicted alpha/beta-hydrolase family hydrolase
LLSFKAIVSDTQANSFDVLKPEGESAGAAIILAHGAGQGMQSPFMTYFYKELARRGFLSVRFNFDYIEAKRRVPDPQPKLRARYRGVVESVIAQYKHQRLIIGGKSMGGRVASYIAGDTPGIDGLVFLGYPLHPPAKPDQLRDEHLYSLRMPMLFISGSKDTFARRDLLERVVEKIGKYATLIWVDGGDHSLKRGRKDTESLEQAAETIDQWVRRRLSTQTNQ